MIEICIKKRGQSPLNYQTRLIKAFEPYQPRLVMVLLLTVTKAIVAAVKLVALPALWKVMVCVPRVSVPVALEKVPVPA